MKELKTLKKVSKFKIFLWNMKLDPTRPIYRLNTAALSKELRILNSKLPSHESDSWKVCKTFFVSIKFLSRKFKRKFKGFEVIKIGESRTVLVLSLNICVKSNFYLKETHRCVGSLRLNLYCQKTSLWDNFEIFVGSNFSQRSASRRCSIAEALHSVLE